MNVANPTGLRPGVEHSLDTEAETNTSAHHPALSDLELLSASQKAEANRAIARKSAGLRQCNLLKE